MTERYQALTQKIKTQNENRGHWGDTDSPEHLLRLIQEETAEAVEAVQEAYLTGDVTAVASELGDLQYLLIRVGLMVGIDPLIAAEMKHERNSRKYPDHLIDDDTYSQRVTKDKATWKAMGGDIAYSHAYLEHIADGMQDAVWTDGPRTFEETKKVVDGGTAVVQHTHSKNGNGHSKEPIGETVVVYQAPKN